MSSASQCDFKPPQKRPREVTTPTVAAARAPLHGAWGLVARAGDASVGSNGVALLPALLSDCTSCRVRHSPPTGAPRLRLHGQLWLVTVIHQPPWDQALLPALAHLLGRYSREAPQAGARSPTRHPGSPSTGSVLVKGKREALPDGPAQAPGPPRLADDWPGQGRGSL